MYGRGIVLAPKHDTMETGEGVELKLHTFFTLILDEGK
jgi:hypothetical protein